MGQKKMSKRNLRGFRYEHLEDRRLLAADFATEVFDCSGGQPEQCQVAPVETIDAIEDCLSAINTGDVDTDSELAPETVDAIIEEVETEIDDVDSEIEIDVEIDVENEIDAETEVVTENDPVLDTEVELEPEVVSTTEESEITIDTETEVEDESETDSAEVDIDLVADPIELTELGDPVQGTLGHFGDLNAESMSESLSIAPSQAGMIDVAIASSDGEALPQFEVVDSQGDEVELNSTDTAGSFQLLTFEAAEGESYRLTVSHAEACDDFFMVTIGFEEIPEPVDMHADEMGDSSTVLEFTENLSTLDGMLESAGDIDTFRFTAITEGKASLNIREMIAENSTELDVTVYDGDGIAISHGATNETAEISFDVAENGQYFVAVTAMAEQVGEYQLGLELMPNEIDGQSDPQIADDHANEIGPEATELTFEDSIATVSGELETTEDQDAFQFVSPIDGEAVVSVAATSEGSSSDAIVSVFDSASETTEPTAGEVVDGEAIDSEAIENVSNELIVAGTTNETVSLRFDVTSGNEYQLLVDSLNDVPTSYELNLTLVEGVSDPVDVDPVTGVDVETDEAETDLVENEIGNVDPTIGEAVNDAIDDMAICFDVDDVDLSENEELDNFFQGFGDELQSESDLGRNRFFGKRILPWFRQV